MNIKSSVLPNKSFRFNIVGIPPGLRIYLLAPLVTIIFSILFSLLAYDANELYIESFIFINSLAALVGILLLCLLLLFKNEWNQQHGVKLWWIVFITHIAMYVVSTGLNKGIWFEQITEPVTSISFIKSSNDKCEYLIKLESETMKYSYCENYTSEYNRKNDETIYATLIGSIRYGESRADRVEFIDRIVTFK
jgi:fumarate reductase subunit D